MGGSLLFNWLTNGICYVMFGFAISAIYTLKIKKKKNTKQKNDAADNNTKESDHEEVVKSVEIEMDVVRDADQWDNIDRQKSIESILAIDHDEDEESNASSSHIP